MTTGTHPALTVKNYFLPPSAQGVLGDMQQLIDALKQEADPHFLRIYCSDAANQKSVIMEHLVAQYGVESPLISVVEQAPANGTKFAATSYRVEGVAACLSYRMAGIKALELKTLHGQRWIWTSSLHCGEASGSAHQMREAWDTLHYFLMSEGATVAQHVQRTWIYCRDIDNNYAGLVQARNEYFEQVGLTAEKRSIASTGIQARFSNPAQLVQMDTLVILGLDDDGRKYLDAPLNMPPARAYGVAFERGTRLCWEGKSLTLISGTASIDLAGEVVHVGEVEPQVERTLQNIEALTGDLGALSLIVYLRDRADFNSVESAIKAKGLQDYLMLEAPVCRPTWLVEIEAIGCLSC